MDNAMAAHMPKPISPQTHRRIDMLVFPTTVALVVWMFRRNRRAAALIAADAAIQGSALLSTDYPPAFIPAMSFRDHLRFANLHAACSAALTLLIPGIPPRDRRILLGLSLAPLLLNAASRVEDCQGVLHRKRVRVLMKARFQRSGFIDQRHRVW
ncbi:hypothetical protein [Microvirga makkahensis]|uniref:Uncharacterized protein n=1 Tax=Microvirga makkahensis TaxID=1128670 RepID=A0A7X3MSF0_9HYPH|nr:hypothetical protein [Microvirga makkahensis]MXQ12386.1 hypothetical protein [Microvirga makkahensis]